MTALRYPSSSISRQPRLALPSPHPLRAGFVPSGYVDKYPVRDGDNWKSVADRFRVDVKNLIYFNYAIPQNVDFNAPSTKDLINFYLEHVTGCNKTTDDQNWAFSSSASPGIVYIPPPKDMIQIPMDMVIPYGDSRPTRVDPLRDYYRKLEDLDPDETSQDLSRVFDIVSLLSLTLDIMGVTLAGTAAGLGLTVLGPIVGAAAVWIAMGASHEAAINEIKKDLMRLGFSRGLVIGANRHPKHTRTPDFAKTYFFNYVDSNINYPNYRKAFENAYKAAFLLGYKSGLTWDNKERKLLFKNLHANMRPPLDARPGMPGAIADWTNRDWVDYYVEVAGILRRLHLR